MRRTATPPLRPLFYYSTNTNKMLKIVIKFKNYNDEYLKCSENVGAKPAQKETDVFDFG